MLKYYSCIKKLFHVFNFKNYYNNIIIKIINYCINYNIYINYCINLIIYCN